jgi:glycosyltransferase involved in cell wall biosynthesis
MNTETSLNIYGDRAGGDLSLSIVINNFNYERYLSDAITSALGQTSPASEVIVVDDGSTDGSRDIIRGFGDSIIALFKSNGGQTSALNAGFQRARGQILCFLDADDLLEPTATQRIRQAFLQPRVVKAHWPLTVIGPQGRSTGKLKPSHRLHEGALLPRLLEFGPDDPTWVPTSGNAWRRSFLSEIFPLAEPESGTGVGSASADACISMLVPLFGEVALINQPQGKYRVHGANDHSCMDFQRRLNRDVVLFNQRADLLTKHCAQHGLKVDPDIWRENAWCHKLQRALEIIDDVIPSTTPFLLVDDLSWQLPASSTRQAIPFLECNGQYAGPPSDSDDAITQLERMRRSGAKYIAVSWPSFWWFDCYPGFERHLMRFYSRVVKTSELAIFAL